MSAMQSSATTSADNEDNGAPALDEAVVDAGKESQSVLSKTLNVNESLSPVLADSNGSAKNDKVDAISMLVNEESTRGSLRRVSDGSSSIDPLDTHARINRRIARAEARYDGDGRRIRKPGDIWIDEDGEYQEEPYRPPFGLYEIDDIGFGISGSIFRLDAVVKCAHPMHEKDLAIERRIYERLGRHEGILRYYGTQDDCLILEYASNGSIRHYYTYGKEDAAIPLAMKLRWVEEIVETVTFMHSKGVHHADLTGNNMLLDKHFKIKVADFAGSCIDGSQQRVIAGSRFCPPHLMMELQITIGHESFALGSTFYEIMTERVPYKELEDDEVEEAFAAGEFPETGSLPAFGSIIRKCWTQQYNAIEELLTDVKDEVKAKSHQSESLPVPIPCSLSTFILGAAFLLVPLLLTNH